MRGKVINLSISWNLMIFFVGFVLMGLVSEIVYFIYIGFWVHFLAVKGLFFV